MTGNTQENKFLMEITFSSETNNNHQIIHEAHVELEYVDKGFV